MAYQPLNTSSSLETNFNILNSMIRDLNNQAITKTYNQPGGNVIIEGKLPYNGGYGTLYYDSNNIPRIVIGILPDGSTGMAISKDGQDVIQALT
jgi:hypothetical protein